MKRLEILPFGDPVLRMRAAEVTVFRKNLHQTIDQMAYTLKKSDDGAALAAPQVGVLKRIVVVNALNEYLELINPVIIEREGEQDGPEGCLSFPSFFGRVVRSDRIKIRYQDRHGKPCELERSGFMARCFQHEIDHLDGILFIDRMVDSDLKNDDTGQTIALRAVQTLAPLPLSSEQPINSGFHSTN